MDLKNIARNIMESSFDMDLIGEDAEVIEDGTEMIERALKSLKCMTKNNINSCEFGCLLGALERIFDK